MLAHLLLQQQRASVGHLGSQRVGLLVGSVELCLDARSICNRLAERGATLQGILTQRNHLRKGEEDLKIKERVWSREGARGSRMQRGIKQNGD